MREPEVWRFLCAQCHIPLSGPLLFLTDLSRLRTDVGDMHRDLNLVPPGFFAHGGEAKAAMQPSREPVRWKETDILFFPNDLILDKTRLLPGDRGCCGLIGTHGFNAFCTNGHAVGTQVTDCCTLNLAYIPRANLVFDTPAAL